MTKHQINFDEASYSNVISNAIKGAKKRALYESDDIVITRNELKKIESLNNIRAEKMTFVLLCMAKQQAKINDFMEHRLILQMVLLDILLQSCVKWQESLFLRRIENIFYTTSCAGAHKLSKAQ